MKCISPFTQGGNAYGCGRCTPCRMQMRRIWKTRIIAERFQHKHSQFVTLTYSDQALPLIFSDTANSILPTLVPRHLQLFLKRLRRDYPVKLRFFGVGEYGNKTFRPHYHVGIFGLQPCHRGKTLESRTGRQLWAECCPTCRMVGETWKDPDGKQYGDIEVRDLGTEKCEYLARYVTKKLTKKEDARLLGRHPEFSRQSRRPGIGAAAVVKLAELIEQYCSVDELVDVPMTIQHGTKQLPLGRYMRGKLRLALGLPEGAPDEVLRQAWYEQVSPLLALQKKDSSILTLREAFRRQNQAYSDSLELKMSIYEKGKL